MAKFIPGGPERYEHQVRGLMKLIETRGRAALLFDPGLGKTATAIDYMSLLALKSPTREVRVLVVCPLAAVDTWVLQMDTFASPQVAFTAEVLGGSIKDKVAALSARGPAGVNRSLHARKAVVRRSRGVDSLDRPAGDLPRVVLAVVNIDIFASRSEQGSRTTADLVLAGVRDFAPDLVVVDESHRIKSASGNSSRLLARVAQIVPRRVILTGTVMPHSPLDVYAQWRFLDPTAFGPEVAGERRSCTLGHFRSRFAVMGGWMGKEIVRYQRLDEMQDVMARNAVVARKEDALDLPPVTDVLVPVELSAAERRAYEQMRKDLAVALAGDAEANVPNRLAQMMRLRQITSGYLPDDNGVIHRVGESKARTIASIVNDNLAGEKRVVVFCNFRHEIAALAPLLASAGTEVLTVTGDTSSAERIAIRQRFGSSDSARLVLVAQVRTMSLAVNELVTASHAVYGSLSQLRDDYVQSRDRLNRIGQTKPVTYWLAVAPGTVDEVILQAHQQRENLETAMLRHIQDGA